eukprot:881502-Rhodomonas_salina.1
MVPVAQRFCLLWVRRCFCLHSGWVALATFSVHLSQCPLNSQCSLTSQRSLSAHSVLTERSAHASPSAHLSRCALGCALSMTVGATSSTHMITITHRLDFMTRE